MTFFYSSAGAGAAVFITEKINQKRVMLFSKKRDPSCKRVKEILASYKMSPEEYEAFEMDGRQDINQIEDYFVQRCLLDRRQVPLLFINGKFIGGEEEILRFHESGTLLNSPESSVLSLESRESLDLPPGIFAFGSKGFSIHATDSECKKILALPSKYSVTSSECQRLLQSGSEESMDSEECRELFEDGDKQTADTLKELPPKDAGRKSPSKR